MTAGFLEHQHWARGEEAETGHTETNLSAAVSASGDLGPARLVAGRKTSGLFNFKMRSFRWQGRFGGGEGDRVTF